MNRRKAVTRDKPSGVGAQGQWQRKGRESSCTIAVSDTSLRVSLLAAGQRRGGVSQFISYAVPLSPLIPLLLPDCHCRCHCNVPIIRPLARFHDPQCAPCSPVFRSNSICLQSIRMCFCRELYVVNCHLSAGPEAPRRLRQVHEALDTIRKEAKKVCSGRSGQTDAQQ